MGYHLLTDTLRAPPNRVLLPMITGRWALPLEFMVNSGSRMQIVTESLAGGRADVGSMIAQLAILVRPSEPSPIPMKEAGFPFAPAGAQVGVRRDGPL